MEEYKPMWSQFLSETAAIVTDKDAAICETTGLSQDDYPKPRWKADGRWTCLCRYCHHEFAANRMDAKFCTPNHRKAWSRRKDQIENARQNIVLQIDYINRMVKEYPDLEIFASLELDKIRKLLSVASPVVTFLGS
jgi:hypothetical protein